MQDELSRLFEQFDNGKISRRRLMQVVGVAAAAAPLAAFGQGSCGGPNAGTPKCNTSPMKAPFEPTGWKTVLLDHFDLQVAELDKEAAFYNALMGWKVRSNNGKSIVMDIGNWGGVIMRGGLALPNPKPTPPSQLAALAESAQALAQSAGALAAAEERARGGGRGARGGGGGGRGPNAGPRAVWDGFCFGIAPWDTNKVEGALKQRGLNPVAEHRPQENFFSFRIKDPDGFNLSVSNGNKMNRRNTPATGELNMAPPFEPTGWQTVYLDHISFGVSSYKETVAFYQALLGWIPGGDEGSLNETTISPEIGGLLIRGPNALAPDFKVASPRRASMGHIAFGITPFDPDKVKEELYKRGLSASADTGAIESSPASEKDIHTSTYKSYHTTTPNGFNLQISNHTKMQNIILG
jgi:predicted enzyme related to lactoylglutathione lyase